MTEAIILTIFLTILGMAFIRGLQSYLHSQRHFMILATPENLNRKLELVRKYGGFNDEFDLQNGEIQVTAVVLDPYRDSARINYMIQVPNYVLEYANYDSRKLSIEEIFGDSKDD